MNSMFFKCNRLQIYNISLTEKKKTIFFYALSYF